MNKMIKLSEFLLERGLLKDHFSVVKLAAAAEPFKEWFDGKDTIFLDLKTSEYYETGVRRKFPKVLEMAKSMGAEDSEIKLSEGISGLPSRKKSLSKINSLFFERYLEKIISEKLQDFKDKSSAMSRIISWLMSRHSVMSMGSFKQDLRSDFDNESFDIIIKFLEENIAEISDVSVEAKKYISSPIHLKNIDNKVVAITKDPKHIIGMSPIDDWGSCMAVGGSMHEEAYREVVDGGFIAFLVDREDVEISKPYARIWVRRLDSTSRDISYAVPEDVTYGSDHPLLRGTLQSWIDSKQGDLKNVIGEFVVSGGRQSDTFESVHSIVSTESSVELIQNPSGFFEYNDKVFLLKDYAVSTLRDIMPAEHTPDDYPDEHGNVTPIMRNVISGSTERINISRLIGNSKYEVIISDEAGLATATKSFINKATNNILRIEQVLDVFFTKKSLENAIVEEKISLGLEDDIDDDKILVGDLSGSRIISSIFEKESVFEVKSLMLPCLETVYRLAYDGEEDDDYRLSLLMSKNRFIRSVELGFEELKKSKKVRDFLKVITDPEKRFSVDVFSAKDFEKGIFTNESVLDTDSPLSKVIQLAKENVVEEIISGSLVPSEDTVNFMVKDVENPKSHDVVMMLSNLEYAEKIGFLEEYLYSIEHKANGFSYFYGRSPGRESSLDIGQLSTLIDAVNSHIRNSNFDLQVDTCKMTIVSCLSKGLEFARNVNIEIEKSMSKLSSDASKESSEDLLDRFKNVKDFFSCLSDLCLQSHAPPVVGEIYDEILRYNSNLDKFNIVHENLSGNSGVLDISFLPVRIYPEKFLMSQSSSSISDYLKSKVSSIKFKYPSRGVRVNSKVKLVNRRGSLDIWFDKFYKILQKNKHSFEDFFEVLISSIDRDLLSIERQYKESLKDINKVLSIYKNTQMPREDRSFISAQRKLVDNLYNRYRVLVIMKSKIKNLMSGSM